MSKYTLLSTLFLLFSLVFTYTFNFKTNKKLTVNKPNFLSTNIFNAKDNILGTTDTNEPLVVNTLLVTPTPTITQTSTSNKNKSTDKQSDNKKTNEDDDDTSNEQNEVTDTNLVLLQQKANYISQVVSKNTPLNSSEVSNIFLPELVSFFGEEQFANIFKGINNINFVNLQVNNNEATASVIVDTLGTPLTYTLHFYMVSNDWYIAKSEGY